MLIKLLYLVLGLSFVVLIPMGIIWVAMKWANMNESGMGYKGKYKTKQK